MKGEALYEIFFIVFPPFHLEPLLRRHALNRLPRKERHARIDPFGIMRIARHITRVGKKSDRRKNDAIWREAFFDGFEGI